MLLKHELVLVRRRMPKYVCTVKPPYSSLNPSFSAYKILEEPLLVHRIGDPEERAEMVYKALEEVRDHHYVACHLYSEN